MPCNKTHTAHSPLTLEPNTHTNANAHSKPTDTQMCVAVQSLPSAWQVFHNSVTAYWVCFFQPSVTMMLKQEKKTLLFRFTTQHIICIADHLQHVMEESLTRNHMVSNGYVRGTPQTDFYVLTLMFCKLNGKYCYTKVSFKKSLQVINIKRYIWPKTHQYFVVEASRGSHSQVSIFWPPLSLTESVTQQ